MIQHWGSICDWRFIEVRCWWKLHGKPKTESRELCVGPSERSCASFNGCRWVVCNLLKGTGGSNGVTLLLHQMIFRFPLHQNSYTSLRSNKFWFSCWLYVLPCWLRKRVAAKDSNEILSFIYSRGRRTYRNGSQRYNVWEYSMELWNHGFTESLLLYIKD